jgi:hypothetical protein
LTTDLLHTLQNLELKWLGADGFSRSLSTPFRTVFGIDDDLDEELGLGDVNVELVGTIGLLAKSGVGLCGTGAAALHGFSQINELERNRSL